MDDTNIFDQFVNPPAETPAAAAIPPEVKRVVIEGQAPPPPNFDQFTQPSPPVPAPADPNAVDWSRMNAPFGELKPVDRSYTEAAKSTGQDILAAGGMDPYRARHISEGLVDIGGFTPMGTVLSAADLTYHAPKVFSGDRKMANFGNATLDAIGAIPGVRMAQRAIQARRGTLPMTRMADTPTRTIDPVTGRPNDELLQSARGHYNAVANAPIDFNPGTMPRFTDAARMALQQPQYGAFTPEAAAGVHGVLERWGRDFAGNRIATPHDFDVLRQQLRGFTDGADSAAGPRAADFIDQFLANPPPGAVLRAAPGALDSVRRHQANARADYRAGKTAETFDYAIDRAGTKAGGAHSGLNLDNTTRQAISALTDPPVGATSKVFGASYPELQQFRTVSAGDPITNRLRYTGNRMGGGGGIGGTLMGGVGGHTVNSLLGSWGVDPIVATTVGTGVGWAWPKVGEAFRHAANERTVRAAEEAVANVRRNSALYRTREAAAPDIVDPMAMTRDAIAYALLPQAAQAAREPWDKSFVPYKNR